MTEKVEFRKIYRENRIKGRTESKSLQNFTQKDNVRMSCLYELCNFFKVYETFWWIHHLKSMSRSALEKQLLRQQAEALKAQSLANYQLNHSYSSFYYGQQTAPVSSDIYSSAGIYIPLVTGDDEEYEDPQHKPNALTIHGNSTNFNINSLLYNNIMENEYFRALYQLRTYHEVIGEIQRSVKHVEPWQTGTSRFPSSAFCLMVKFLLMRLTLKQMNGLLNFEGCSFVRAIGFLYLRYTCAPAELWKYYEPYLEDNEEIQPCSDKSVKMSVGQYITKLLTDMQYYGTTLPRIPVPIERKIKVLLLLLDQKQRRRKQNLKMKEKFTTATKVRAIYSDNENEPAWYDAVIDSIDQENANTYWVTYPEYGNSAAVDLGDMELITVNHDVDSKNKNEYREEREGKTNRNTRSCSRSHSRSRSHSSNHNKNERNRSQSRERKDRRSRSPQRRYTHSPDRRSHSNSREHNHTNRTDKANKTDDLLAKVIQSERDASAAVGRNYGHRPTSYKGALSMKLDRYTVRKKSPSPERGQRKNRKRSRSPESSPPKAVKANLESSIEQSSRLKILRDKYGDASAK